MAGYVPPGWPTGVHPPGSEGFERTAVAWLLDVVPPDYRLYGVLRRHPVALATMACHHLAASVEGARQGYRTARTELGGALPPHALDAVLDAYRSEGRRLVATAAAADLIARALRGEEFVPRLRDRDAGAAATPPARPAAAAPGRARPPDPAAVPARPPAAAPGRARPPDPATVPARPAAAAPSPPPTQAADAVGHAPEPPMANPGGITRRPRRPAAKTRAAQANTPAGERQ